MNLGVNSSYFVGSDGHDLYFGNAISPLDIIKANLALTDTGHIKLKNKSFGRIIHIINNIKIGYPNLYLLQGQVKNIIIGDIRTRELITVQETLPFDLSAYDGDSILIVRNYDVTLHQNILSKITFGSLNVPHARFKLDNLGDGVFSLDGTLNIEPVTKTITYVYYYSNKFLVLDSNLNLIYRGHTIDTTFHENLKVVTLKKKGISTLATPPQIINKLSSVNSKWLFVNSYLKADNESKKEFGNNSVIDVYSIKNGKYQFSFYISNYNNQRLSNLYVFGNCLLAFFGQYVFLYRIEF